MIVDEGPRAGIKRERAVRKQRQFFGLQGGDHEPVCHIDAELIALQSAAGVTV